ncbi:MAG: hypothetical protein V1690_00860 [Candidatus Moraniibacteriota bacterium]
MRTVKNLFKKSSYLLVVLALGIVVGVTIKYVTAWVEPDAMPPGGNIAAPLNTSNIGQVKVGGLTLNIGGSTYGLIVDKGFVGIDTSTPLAELDVNGDIRAHNLNLNQNLNVAGDGHFGGNVNVNGDIHARNFVVNSTNGNTNVSVGPNGICLNGVCKTTWEEVCATCSGSNTKTETSSGVFSCDSYSIGHGSLANLWENSPGSCTCNGVLYQEALSSSLPEGFGIYYTYPGRPKAVSDSTCSSACQTFACTPISIPGLIGVP